VLVGDGEDPKLLKKRYDRKNLNGKIVPGFQAKTAASSCYPKTILTAVKQLSKAVLDATE
jgi:hypothetical protein